jgi:hypothetical protein
MEKSINQPSLPHLIITLNVTDTQIYAKKWDPEYATRSLMSEMAEAVGRNPNYKKLKAFWIARGKTISTMQDLLECYYTSITVVHIPDDGRYVMIDSQVQTLYNTLSKRCKDSFHAKERSRMLSTSEDLHLYFDAAFDHFANDLNTPFDFMKVSSRIDSIPLDFTGNILKLAIAMRAGSKAPKIIFEELSFMAASCILLDSVRQKLRGMSWKCFNVSFYDHDLPKRRLMLRNIVQ